MDRDERMAAARELAGVLRGAHEARNANPTMRAWADMAPVPAVRQRDEDPTLMILAYALLVDDLMQQFHTAPPRPMVVVVNNAAPEPPVVDDVPCTGCGVSVGQTHWDNCPHHPPFSQPVYRGGGR